ncbi:hypothetical protein [Paraburkholderia sp. BCC1885]|uniref:hypothetical protein n=1 Tax=Paraburkholderia sp. BCC1885 TaxID=2562669 RepID=UPI00118455D4|nr:hypothetical protein [Paraburkholderia sp. BCC1885]
MKSSRDIRDLIGKEAGSVSRLRNILRTGWPSILLILAFAAGYAGRSIQGQSTLKTMLLVLALLYTTGFLLCFAIRQVVPKHSVAVYVLWYFFSLSLVLTILLKCAASGEGWVDGKGVATGSIGKSILWLSAKVFDLPDEFNLFVGVAAALVAPQIIAYLLSGAFGCAAAPKWVLSVTRTVCYMMAKSFIVAAGVLIPFAWFARGWGQIPDFHTLLATECLAILLVGFAFLFLWYACSLEDIETGAAIRSPNSTFEKILKVHGWMIRNRQKSTGPLPNRSGSP